MIITMCILAALFVFMNAGKASADADDIAGEIRGFLLDDDWHFDYNDESRAFRFGVNLSCKLKNLNYFVPVRDDAYIVYAVSPISADSDDRELMSTMCEFVCRANYGLRNGCFELDVTDGELRYKVFVDCEGDQLPTKDVIRNSIIVPAMMFERYAPGILDIMFKGSSAEEAVESCEN